MSINNEGTLLSDKGGRAVGDKNSNHRPNLPPLPQIVLRFLSLDVYLRTWFCEAELHYSQAVFFYA